MSAAPGICSPGEILKTHTFQNAIFFIYIYRSPLRPLLDQDSTTHVVDTVHEPITHQYVLQNKFLFCQHYNNRPPATCFSTNFALSQKRSWRKLGGRPPSLAPPCRRHWLLQHKFIYLPHIPSKIQNSPNKILKLDGKILSWLHTPNQQNIELLTIQVIEYKNCERRKIDS